VNDTRPVRPSEQLDWDQLAAYLREHLGISGDLHVEQFPGGHSNLTYALTLGERELVLRRPPFGPVPPRAHDMAREFRVLQAVHPHFPLAPKPYLLCEDLSIIGSVFYVMERRRGLVLRDDGPEDLAPLRPRISDAVVDTLADLHAIDVTAHGLDSLGKPAGFVARQVRGWTERWHGSKTSDIPEMESLALWLAERIPADPPQATLVHGDYKLDNLMLDEREPWRLVGVFDWEMSALGDPLVDLGILLCYQVHTAQPQPGWFSRDAILTRYAERSGRSLDNIAFYEVFAVFKLAVVIQQIYARYVRGQTDDPRFAPLGDRVAILAGIATRLAT
jgi:aminoglycoside phosphotransferase (APT) family kinase protein